MNDTIISALTSVSSVAVGDFGMPGGFWGFTSKAADTIMYFFGMMLNAIASMAVTGLDIVSTIRDLGASISQGNVIGVVLNALSLVPVLGALEGASDLVKTAQKWLSAFPSKADEVLGFLSSTILKHLPDWIGGKLLGLVSDAPVSKLVDEGIPVEDIVKYGDEVDFQKVLELRSQGVSPVDIRYYVENDIDLGLVSKLRTKNIPASDIRRYVEEGVDLNKVKRLRRSGLSPRATKYVVIKDANPKMIRKLSDDISTKKILHYFDEGADLKMINKLRSQNIPVNDITWYVDNSISLTGVNKIAQRRIMTPKRTRKVFRILKTADEWDKYKEISEKELKVLNMKLGFGGSQRYSDRVLQIVKAAYGYIGWKDAKQEQDGPTRNQNGPTRRSIQYKDQSIYRQSHSW